jgi:hypothetical protein
MFYLSFQTAKRNYEQFVYMRKKRALLSKMRTKLFLAYDSAATVLSKVKVTIIFKIFISVYIPVPVTKSAVMLAITHTIVHLPSYVSS